MGLCVTPKKLEYKYYKGKVEKGKENIMEHQEREREREKVWVKERKREREKVWVKEREKKTNFPDVRKFL